MASHITISQNCNVSKCGMYAVIRYANEKFIFQHDDIRGNLND